MIGVAEADGSLICEDGINPEQLLKYKREKKGTTGFLSAIGGKGEHFVDERAIYYPW